MDLREYRKKPVVIEAIRYTGKNDFEIEEWSRNSNGNRGIITSPVLEPREGNPTGAYLQIDTLEGIMTASPGDWIIKGVKGEFYPCKPDIFAVTYEQADELPVDLRDRIKSYIKLVPVVVDLPEQQYLVRLEVGGQSFTLHNHWSKEHAEWSRDMLATALENMINELLPKPFIDEEICKDRPKIVCLCGSGRFKQAFDEAEFNETLSGKIVLTIGCNTHDVARSQELQQYKPMLDALHKHKIDLCDEVLVLNVDGYIGESTRSEIEYAEAHGKLVRYLEPVTQAQWVQESKG